ncbi:MAG: hypothetical protein ACRC6R_03645 [Bacteroidales bacterium]
MKSRLLLTLLTFTVVISGLFAQRVGSWEKLGERTVDRKLDRDEIRVSNRRTYSKLKFNVKGGEVRFDRVVVEFENGAKQELQIRQTIPAGGETRVIDLRGNQRFIKRITFHYKTTRGHKVKARVSVWGR